MLGPEGNGNNILGMFRLWDQGCGGKQNAAARDRFADALQYMGMSREGWAAEDDIHREREIREDQLTAVDEVGSRSKSQAICSGWNCNGKKELLLHGGCIFMERKGRRKRRTSMEVEWSSWGVHCR